MGTMTRADVMAHPRLRDQPLRIELNRRGRIEMSPESNEHGKAQMDVGAEICVEIMSRSNTWAAMHIKAGLYLEAGAEAAWIQTLDGQRSVIKPPKP